MRSVLPSFLLVLGVALPASAAAPVQSVEVLSEPYRVDRKFGSMMGPMSAQTVSLEQGPWPELLWIVYENTSGEDRDSMAVMYLYVLDREYRRPALLFDPRKDKGGTS